MEIGSGGLLGLLYMAIAGGIIGVIARALMPGPNPMGMGLTIVLGIAGSIVGGLIARLLGLATGAGWVISILGAMLLLWIIPRMRKAA